MKGFVGVTDNDWFAFLSQQPGLDEVNFWQPRRIGWQFLHREFPLLFEMSTSLFQKKTSSPHAHEF